MAFKTKKDLIKYCLTYPDVYEDYPFHDTEWAVIRHRKNKKVFAWIYTREEKTCVNVKCNPMDRILEKCISGRSARVSS